MFKAYYKHRYPNILNFTTLNPGRSKLFVYLNDLLYPVRFSQEDKYKVTVIFPSEHADVNSHKPYELYPKLSPLLAKPWRGIRKDFIDTFKPFKGRGQIIRNLLQPLYGLGNLAKGLLLLLIAPIYLMCALGGSLQFFALNLLFDFFHAHHFDSKLAKGLQYEKNKYLVLGVSLLEGLSWTFRGLSQLVFTPLMVLKLMLRELITLFNPLPLVEHNPGIQRKVNKLQGVQANSIHKQRLEKLHNKYLAAIAKGQATAIANEVDCYSAAIGDVTKSKEYLVLFTKPKVLASSHAANYQPIPNSSNPNIN